MANTDSINVTHNVTALFDLPAVKPLRHVQTTEEIITTKGRSISAGAVIVINPELSPDDSQMVLVGNSIEAWKGQRHDGVAVGFMTDFV